MANQKTLTFYTPPGFPTPVGSAPCYAYALKVKPGVSWIYISGIGPVDDEGKGLVGFDIYEQTTRCMDRIKKILEEAGATLADVVSVHMSIVDIKDWERWVDAYGEYYKKQFPCGVLEVLPGFVHGPGQLVQMDVIAAVG